MAVTIDGTTGITTPAISSTTPAGVASGGTGAATLTANNVVLGNGTGAVQFVAPGSSGNVLTSNGTTWTSSVPASGLTLLQAVTASSSATIDLETSIGSGYDAYMIVYTAAVTAGDLYCRLKIGGTYIATATYRNRYVNQSYANTTWTVTADTTSTGIYLTGYASGNGAGGTIIIPGATSVFNGLMHQSVSGAPLAVTGFASVTDVGAWSGIRFYPPTGTITSGTFRLYGFQKS